MSMTKHMNIGTPNPTPTTLRDLLEVTTCEDCSSEVLTQATQSIQEQLLALLPEKKPTSNLPTKEHFGEIIIDTDKVNFIGGYNSAIDQIQKAIEEWAR